MTTARIKLIETLKDSILRIDGTNGFVNNLTDRVYVNKIFISAAEQQGRSDPIVSIIQYPRSQEAAQQYSGGNSVSKTKFPILIEGLVVNRLDDDWKNAEILMSEIKKVLLEAAKMENPDGTRNPFGLGRSMSSGNYSIGQGLVLPAEENSIYQKIRIECYFDFVEDMLNPFNQT